VTFLFYSLGNRRQFLSSATTVFAGHHRRLNIDTEIGLDFDDLNSPGSSSHTLRNLLGHIQKRTMRRLERLRLDVDSCIMNSFDHVLLQRVGDSLILGAVEVRAGYISPRRVSQRFDQILERKVAQLADPVLLFVGWEVVVQVVRGVWEGSFAVILFWGKHA